MTHEEYLEMNDKVKKYIELNTKKSDLLSLKSNMNLEGSLSIIGKDKRIRNISEIDSELHENIKEVVNVEIGKLIENIVIQMNSI